MTIQCWQVHHLLCHQAKPEPKNKFVVIVGVADGVFYAAPINSRAGITGQYTPFGPDGYPFLDRVSHACFNDLWCFAANHLNGSTLKGSLFPEDVEALKAALMNSPIVRPKTKRILCS